MDFYIRGEGFGAPLGAGTHTSEALGHDLRGVTGRDTPCRNGPDGTGGYSVLCFTGLSRYLQADQGGPLGHGPASPRNTRRE